MLNSDQRWIADAFMRELAAWDLTEKAPPLHTVHRRMALADMVLSECQPDNLQLLALNGLASAAIDLCLAPNDIRVAGCYVKAKFVYVGTLLAGLK